MFNISLNNRHIGLDSLVKIIDDEQKPNALGESNTEISQSFRNHDADEHMTGYQSSETFEAATIKTIGMGVALLFQPVSSRSRQLLVHLAEMHRETLKSLIFSRLD